MKYGNYPVGPVDLNGIVGRENWPSRHSNTSFYLSPLATLILLFMFHRSSSVHVLASRRLSISSIISRRGYLFLTVIVFSSW